MDKGYGTKETAASSENLNKLDAWWRAANYLSVAQIYLLDNPLLREPLSAAAATDRIVL